MVIVRSFHTSYILRFKRHNPRMILVRNNTPRRAYMYVPGDDVKKINKALGLDVDCIVMDCEDGVAINKKDAARATIRSLLDQGKPSKQREYDFGARVNSVNSGLCKDDLSALLTAKHLPDTISLPKIDDKEQLHWFADQVNSLIRVDKKINLVMFVESAVGIMELPQICKTALELSKKSKFVPTSLVFGRDDLCASIGATPTESGLETLYARQKLVLIAKAFQLQAIDMVHIQYKDLEGLRKQCEEGAGMGYTGKQVIHPAQVPVVQKAFLPNQKQIERAKGLLKAFDEHQKVGKGAFTYKGSMIDMPTMKQAQNIMNLVNTAHN